MVVRTVERDDARRRGRTCARTVCTTLGVRHLAVGRTRARANRPRVAALAAIGSRHMRGTHRGLFPEPFGVVRRSARSVSRRLRARAPRVPAAGPHRTPSERGRGPPSSPRATPSPVPKAVGRRLASSAKPSDARLVAPRRRPRPSSRRRSRRVRFIDVRVDVRDSISALARRSRVARRTRGPIVPRPSPAVASSPSLPRRVAARFRWTCGGAHRSLGLDAFGPVRRPRDVLGGVGARTTRAVGPSARAPAVPTR